MGRFVHCSHFSLNKLPNIQLINQQENSPQRRKCRDPETETVESEGNEWMWNAPLILGITGVTNSSKIKCVLLIMDWKCIKFLNNLDSLNCQLIIILFFKGNLFNYLIFAFRASIKGILIIKTILLQYELLCTIVNYFERL